jgi:hypothetical protein
MLYYGFIFAGEVYEKQLDTKIFKMKVAGVADLEDAIGVAKKMVEEGVHLIELCGDFGPVWAGKIIEAIDNKIPLGFVTYGAEAMEGLSNLPSGE